VPVVGVIRAIDFIGEDTAVSDEWILNECTIVSQGKGFSAKSDKLMGRIYGPRINSVRSTITQCLRTRTSNTGPETV
jgi:hypothetical protein